MHLISKHRKNKFNLADWEHTTVDGKIYLHGYKGHESTVVFPTGSNYIIDLRDAFKWGTFGRYITDIDFSNLPCIGDVPMSFLRNSMLTNIYNADEVLRNIRGTFEGLSFIKKVPTMHKVTHCTSAFSDSLIEEPVDIYGTFSEMERTYSFCKNLRSPCRIPPHVKALRSTFAYSGITKGADLSHTQVKVMECVYAECLNMVHGGFFSSCTESMDCTFLNCIKLEKVGAIPDNVRIMNKTFSSCINMKEQPKVPKGVKLLLSTYSNCIQLTYAKPIPYGVLRTTLMYSNCHKLIVGADIPDTVVDTCNMYSNCKKLKRGAGLGHSIIAASSMYSNCFVLEYSPDLPKSIKFASGMFERCYKLMLPPKIPGVIVANRLFSECTTLQVAPIIPECVKFIDMMFYKCYNLTGDVVIKSKSIESAHNLFGELLSQDIYKYHKRVYIPFNSKTYDTFKNHGYLTQSTQDKFNFEILPIEEYNNDKIE